ncbi:MAG TPA: CHAT domain-containing protein [Pyrinomonadaceae bacterium]|nr:CHAT domain-containing protein [Pyrinomonadaceae bacterium]
MEVPANSIDARLLGIAELVRRGRFVLAEQKLNSLEQESQDAQSIFAVHLFRLQLLQRRYAITGGGRLYNGSSQLDLVKKDRLSKALLQQMDVLGRQMLPGAGMDAGMAIRYSNILDYCVYGSPPLARLNRITYEFNSDLLSPSVGQAANSQPCLQELSGLNQNALSAGILRRAQQDLLVALVKGTFAIANQDFADAKSIYEGAVALALQEGLSQSAEAFLLRRGDLEVAPHGDVLTLGYNLLAEEGVRTMLRYGDIPRIIITPPASQLDAAEGWYNKAEDISKRIADTNISGALIIRRAHLARLRRDYSGASRLYKEAASAARISGRVNDAALATAGYAFLQEQAIGAGADTSPRDAFSPLQEAIDSLAQNGDMGGVLSIAELTNSAATRLWYIDHDLIRSSRLLRQAIGALEKNNQSRATVELLFTLSSVYMESGRAETGIQIVQEAVSRQTAFIKEAEAFNEEYRKDQPELGKDLVGVTSEKNRQANFLTRMGTPLFGIYLEERTPFWRDQVDSIDRQADALSAEVAAARPELAPMVQQTLQGREAARRITKFYDDVVSGFRSRLTCQGILQVYGTLRPRANELVSPLSVAGLNVAAELNGAGLDLAAGRCNPDLLKSPRAELQKGSPVASLSRSLTAYSQTPTVQTRLAAVNAVRALNIYFNLAARFDSYELLSRWLDELDALMRDNPRLQILDPLARAYRATALLGLNQTAKARDVLNGLVSDKAIWAAQSPQFKIEVLDTLVEAETTLGNANEGLLAFEQMRFEQEQWQGQKSGVRPASRLSAELAMLERKAAGSGGLSDDDLRQLRQLRKEVENSSPGDQSPPSLRVLQSAVAAMPEGTTALVFHVGRRYITLWRVRANQPSQVVRLESPVDDILRLVVRLERSLSGGDGNNEWEGFSRQLYQKLIVPVALTSSDARLVFIVQGKLSLIPFEILGADKEHLLLADRPITYASRLTSASTLSRPSIPQNATALVVGLSQDLENAQTEATKIAELLGGTLLIDKNATNEKVRKNIGSARWIHFATHGKVNKSNPYLSYLELFGNERIEAWQLFRDAPQAEVISLSACDTRQEAESAAGMSSMAGDANSLAAFAFAGGARWILASLWQAEDKETELLMTEFYRYQKEEKYDPPKALQMAKLEMVKDSRHPYFYSQFVLSSHDLSSLPK